MWVDFFERFIMISSLQLVINQILINDVWTNFFKKA